MPNKYIKLFINENDFGNIVQSIYKQKEMIEKNTGKSCRPFLSNNKFKPREDIVFKKPIKPMQLLFGGMKKTIKKIVLYQLKK